MAFTRYCKECHHQFHIRNQKTTNLTCSKCGSKWLIVWQPKLVAPLNEVIRKRGDKMKIEAEQ